MLGSRIRHESRYYQQKEEKERRGKKSSASEGRIDVSCCSSRLVLVHGGGGDSLLAITLIGLAPSRHPRSLHSHAFLIAIALAILKFLHLSSQHYCHFSILSLSRKATLSRLLPFSPSWSLSQWPIVIALQNLGPPISAYSLSEKVAK